MLSRTSRGVTTSEAPEDPGGAADPGVAALTRGVAVIQRRWTLLVVEALLRRSRAAGPALATPELPPVFKLGPAEIDRRSPASATSSVRR